MKIPKSNQPLISVILITYNSSEFVLETLESIKAQTYCNIELIVSDDCSKDNTVEICQRWIDENKDRFVNASLVASDMNTGIPANINRGVKISSGLWIKCIAGDDILSQDCITTMFNFVSTSEQEIRILYSDVVRFLGNSVKNVVNKKYDNEVFCSAESSAKDQYKILLRSNRVNAASAMIRKDLLDMMNGFDERYRLLEDWPLWIKITNAGYKIYYIDKPLVYYRLHENNVSMTTDNDYLYHPVSRINLSFKENELIPRLPMIERWGMKHDIFGIRTCFFLGNSRKNLFARFAYFVFNITNPFYTYLRIKKIISLSKNVLNIKHVLFTLL
jgi:glycosyltransferase involved in cell wall biosynthesis